ncbi:hypothetical protein A3A67_02345 [Candidatus Peribacteria bacterium RIFCSPLOWO2_01_FULL_51_18]|nr:MAG: hypothetical protein A3C52_04740 [Candidatus Peribacteria bacterium RIFCSPHIGHO2_02_FULL_51_15]OGJ66855.1 MAG: hypothetical protein A3A67_02345 [Candidatus Peribacteria bacterium RIFCSPLOWO2_01_FULL_51_18]OGJ69657.1 MAG: hypothetical protein A3J34_02735 [Candidatus Peribacteria bacterium RIFCSPLOWO2_02_FULL_51_10]
MIAILIFAGRSRRFWPLQEKSFFPICGTTLIEEQIRRLQSAGIDEILPVAGRHNLALARKIFKREKIVIQEDLNLGMRGALLSALPACGKKPVMIVSSNDVIDESAYRDLIMKGRTKKTGGLILAKRVKKYFPGGYLSLKGKKIIGIVEKPGAGREPGDLVNIVAHVHASAGILLAALKASKPVKDDGYETALDHLFKKESYEAVIYTGPWQAIKYPWHLLSLLPLFLPAGGKPRIAKSARIHPSAVIEGPVVIGENVQVFAHATIRGPCCIGAGTVVASNALVRESSVGENCVIGYSTEVVRSIVAGGVWTHSSYIGDSVVGTNTSFGGGTYTGNLRMDEGEIFSSVDGEKIPTGLKKFGAVIGANCRTGIHVSLSPGIKIGSGSFISSSALIAEDIPDNSFVKTESVKMTVRKNRWETSIGDRDEFRKKL